MSIQGVLFDLDGTLLDTAPDMAGALNELRAEHDLAPLPHSTIRPHVSRGAAALVELGFGSVPGPAHAARVERFLALYRDRLARETKPFDGTSALLDALEGRGIRWGIVTNKPSWLTEPLLATLGLAARARVVVSGDTLSERKPSPAPLLHAARQMQVLPARCVYAGDAERDMQAARAAGMLAIGARFGYIGPTEQPHEWPAHCWIDSPIQLLEWIER